MYLVHSFYAPKCCESIAATNYDVEYSSALQKDNFYGVQFHPEKSGSTGEQILKNFLLLTTND
jgi:glutamine amidotransferase